MTLNSESQNFDGGFKHFAGIIRHGEREHSYWHHEFPADNSKKKYQDPPITELGMQ